MTAIKLNKTDFFEILKGILYSVIFSIIFVIIFALILKLCNADEKVIMPINVAIKILSIMLGCMVAFKSGQKGMLKGFIVGLFFILITYLIFSIINKSFKENPVTVYDFLFCSLAGIISGIIGVNIRKSKSK